MPFVASLPPLRVLIVDDEPEDRVKIRQLLSPPGVGANWAIEDIAQPFAALAKIHEWKPDCVLMAHDLGDNRGLNLLREIIAEHGKDACGFVMLTLSDDTVAAVEMLKAGAHDFLHKGRTTSPQLRKAVRDAYEKAFNRREVRRSHDALEAKNAELAEALAQMTRASARRDQVEEALRKSEHQFRSLADNISQLAWMTDATGSIYWYNRRWFDYTGTNYEDVKGWGWRNVHHPDHLQRVEERFASFLKLGTAWEDTFPLRAADGSYRWFLSRAVPIRDEHGRIEGWFGTNTDITAQLETENALKSARDKAVTASRAKDDFLAALSHELRTPLNPVLLTASARAADPTLPEAVREDFDAIRRNVALEARLIDDLLDLTRITRGKLSLNREELDLYDVLQDTWRIVQAEFEAKGLQWNLTSAPTLARVEGDAVRLRQVLWNVLKNAAKFTPNQGTIAVTLAVDPHRPGCVSVTVVDSGIGMSPIEIASIFEAFAQGSHTASSIHRFGGLGLGLAISRSIVEMHEGSITARSDGAGLGSTFTVTLPLSTGTVAAPAAAAPSAAAAPAPGLTPAAALDRARMGQGYRLLLVEDHPPTRTTMARLLRQRGFQVTGVGSRAEAQALAAAAAGDAAMRVDGLLTDIGLPDGDGCALLLELRESWPQLQGIALSGYGMEQDLLRSRQNGFIQHLIKPIEIDQLDRSLIALVAQMVPPSSSSHA